MNHGARRPSSELDGLTRRPQTHVSHPALSSIASFLPQLNLSLPCCFVCDLGYIIFHLFSLSIFTHKPNKISIMELLRN